MTSSLIILVVIVGLVFWGISIYNGLVAMRQRVSQAFADVDVQLKQRHDLVPNLVETVKAFAAQEREVLTAVVEARAAATSIQVSPEMLDNPEALNQLDDHLVEI